MKLPEKKDALKSEFDSANVYENIKHYNTTAEDFKFFGTETQKADSAANNIRFMNTLRPQFSEGQNVILKHQQDIMKKL